jgi:hypothetical protein
MRLDPSSLSANQAKIHKPPNHLVACVSARMRKNVAHAGALDGNMGLVVR